MLCRELNKLDKHKNNEYVPEGVGAGKYSAMKFKERVLSLWLVR